MQCRAIEDCKYLSVLCPDGCYCLQIYWGLYLKCNKCTPGAVEELPTQFMLQRSKARQTTNDMLYVYWQLSTVATDICTIRYMNTAQILQNILMIHSTDTFTKQPVIHRKTGTHGSLAVLASRFPMTWTYTDRKIQGNVQVCSKRRFRCHNYCMICIYSHCDSYTRQYRKHIIAPLNIKV